MATKSKRKEIHLRHILIFFYLLSFLIPLVKPSSMLAQFYIKNFSIAQISTGDGLSQSTVNEIYRDHRGFLWFATQEGLNRYDGHNFVIFKRRIDNPNSLRINWLVDLQEYPEGVLWVTTRGGGLHKMELDTLDSKNYQFDLNNPQTISNDNVSRITIDPKGIFWIGTVGGFNRFDPKTEIFKRYPTDINNPSRDLPQGLREVLIDKRGDYWVISMEGGLLKFNPNTDNFIQYLHDPKDKKSISHNSLRTIYEDSSGVIWIGTNGGGLNRFQPQDNSFSHYFNEPGNPNSLSHNTVNVILEDPYGNLWIGTERGLNILDRKKNIFLHFEESNPLFSSLNNYIIYSLCWDPSGVLWVGTHGDGVFKLRKQNKGFKHFKHIPNDPTSLTDNRIWSLHIDRSDNLWIGTSGGLCRYIEKYNRFINYRHDPNDPQSLRYNQVMTILDIGDGNLWVGSYGGGVSVLNPKTGHFIYHFMEDPNDPNTLSQNEVLKLYIDRSGILWVGTFGGLNQYVKEKNIFISYENDPKEPESISINGVQTIYEDKNKNFWVGTFGGGLNRLNRGTQKFTRCLTDKNDPYYLNEEIIWDIFEDRNQTLWIGTSGGLKKYDEENQRFITYGLKEGLPNEVIYGILEDDNGHLWVSTNNGLSRFNPQTQHFLNFDESDGLQFNEFNLGAFCKRKNGEMFFGGLNGFNSFFPGKIKINRFKPPLAITNLLINNKPVNVGEMVKGQIILKNDISRQKVIHLTHKHSIFSIEYSGLHYSEPDKNQFAYRMEGLEKEWNYVSNRRFVTYSFIPAGEYKFHLRGANNDGIWNNNGVSIKIVIIPPFWKTWWFYSICILTILLTIMGIYRFRVQQLKRQEKRLTKMVHERTEELEMANRYKSDFLARMSHEIRTPMNSILGFAELALDLKLTNEPQEFLGAIKNSGEALLTLINEILDLSKIEAGQLFLESIDFDPEILAYNVCEYVVPRIGQKPIEILCQIGDQLPANLKGDPSRFRQVLINLMGNAVKFTKRGDIELSINVDEKISNRLKIHVQVRDTGIGIPNEKQNTIFDAFQQGDISDTRKYGGTGLGLAICKQIANAMQGDIWVESEPGKGSIFHFTSWQEISNKKPLKTRFPKLEINNMQGKKALIADDNTNSQKILKKMMIGFKFDVTTISKGEDVLPQIIKAINEEKPYDLCIIDIHMPGMDGYDVVKQIRNHNKKNIANIPIIALSSTIERKTKINREVGFDAFLPKPIRRELLWNMVGQVLAEEPVAVEDKKRIPVLTQHLLAEETKQSIRILMAEDNELNRKLASFVLKKAGYHLEIVVNGKEAIDTFTSNPRKYDLILMDLQMPDMNGTEVTKIIRKKGFTQIPIIALTAGSSNEDRADCINAGMNDYISKPIKREVLYSVIKKWVLPIKK